MHSQVGQREVELVTGTLKWGRNRIWLAGIFLGGGGIRPPLEISYVSIPDCTRCNLRAPKIQIFSEPPKPLCKAHRDTTHQMHFAPP